MEFLTDPVAIEQKSMEIIRGLVGKLNLGEIEEKIVHRVVHTVGDPAIASMVRFGPGAVTAGRQALSNGCSVVTDVRMLAAGISSKALQQHGCELHCALEVAATFPPPLGLTRAMWGMEQLSAKLQGAVVVIGNAPTALVKVLHMLDAEIIRPALIIGTPVGFVGARESKEILTQKNVPYITVRGNRGGSAVAASMVNALLYSLK